MSRVSQVSQAAAFGIAFWWMVTAAAVCFSRDFSLPGRPAAEPAIGSAVAQEPSRTPRGAETR